MQKNTVSSWIVYAYGSSAHATPGDPIELLTDITAGVHIDGAAIAALTDVSPVELSGGYYIFDIAAVENNGDNVLLIAVSATPNVTVIGVPGALYTTPANFNDLSVAVTTGQIDLLTSTQTSIDAIETDTGTTLPTAIADVPTVAEFEARTPTAVQLTYITDHAATALPVTFNAVGGSTTEAVLVLVDGVTASSTNDVYNGRVLIFNAGTLNEQATDITDYVGATKTATITAVTAAVDNTHTAILV